MDDWKDILGNAFGVSSAEASLPDEPAAEAAPSDALSRQGRRPVHIAFERKGRGGKQATIITDLVAGDDALQDLASRLKRACACGGSARGGEILLQGDVRDKAARLLRDMGFNVK